MQLHPCRCHCILNDFDIFIHSFKCFSSSFHMSHTQGKHSSVYVSVWACALSAKEIQTLLFIFSDLHQWSYWRLEIGDYQSQCIKDCFEPLLLFLQHFFLSATFFLHLLHSAGQTSICFSNPRFFAGMVCPEKYQIDIDMHQQHQSQWLSILIHCITISDLQIRRVYPVYAYFGIYRERERERLKLFTLSSKNELTAKVLAGNVQFKPSLRDCFVFFIKLRLASVRSWHLIVAMFGSSTKIQDFLERWPRRKKIQKRKTNKSTAYIYMLYVQYFNLRKPSSVLTDTHTWLESPK